MQALSEKRFANLLGVKFDVDLDNKGNVLSREYFISRSVSFQVQQQFQTIYIKFAKLHEEDPLNYTIGLTCIEFSIKDKTFNEYNKWHLLHVVNKQGRLLVMLLVQLKILPITNSFASLHADRELTDFVLCGEDGSVEIHKVALAVSSPVFRKMFSGKWQEAKEGHVDIKGTSKTTLQHLKDYVYLNTLPDTGLEQLLLLASCYMMPDLEQKCVDKLILKVTADNVSELLKFAVQHELTRLWLSMLDSSLESVIDKAWKKNLVNNTDLA